MSLEAFSESESMLLDALNTPENDLGVMTYDQIGNLLRYQLSYDGFHSMLRDLNAKLRNDSTMDFFLVTDQSGGGRGSLGIAKISKDAILDSDLTQQVENRLRQQSLREIAAISPNTVFHGTDDVKVAPVVKISDQFSNRFGAIIRIKNIDYPILLSSPEQVDTLILLARNGGYIDDKLQNHQHKLPTQVFQINEKAKLSGITEDERLINEVEPIGYCFKGFERRRTEIIVGELLERYASRSQTIIENYLFHRTESAVGATLSTEGLPVRYAIINSENLQSVAFSRQYPYVLVIETPNMVSHTPHRICIELQSATSNLIRDNFTDSAVYINPSDAERKAFERLLARITKAGYEFANDTGVASRKRLIFPSPSN